MAAPEGMGVWLGVGYIGVWYTAGGQRGRCVGDGQAAVASWADSL
jgi:hypothetical protein